MDSNLVGFILAGGKSTRVKELTKDKPKFFLKINGKRIIDYHLDNLSKLGIKTAYIVTGFLKEMVKEAIGDNYKGMKIIYIDNDEFETTKHGYGLFLGRDIFKKNDAVLIFADVFCDPRLYDELLKSDFDNVVLIDEKYHVLTGDELVVQGQNGLISGMGYKRFSEPDVQGEFVGMNKFSKDFLTKLCDYINKISEKESKKLNYEVLIDMFLQDAGFNNLHYKKLNGKKWININYKEDYDEAQKMAAEFKQRKN